MLFKARGSGNYASPCIFIEGPVEDANEGKIAKIGPFSVDVGTTTDHKVQRI